jgi:hypothetical protein
LAPLPTACRCYDLGLFLPVSCIISSCSRYTRKEFWKSRAIRGPVSPVKISNSADHSVLQVLQFQGVSVHHILPGGSHNWSNQRSEKLLTNSESESYVTTDGQSASLSWNKAPIWGLWPDFYYCQTVAGLLMRGAHSDERTHLDFTIFPVPLRYIASARTS